MTVEIVTYTVEGRVLNGADYGVPQVRNRIIIVAFRSDLDVDIERFNRAVRPRYSETALIRSMRTARSAW